MDRVAFDLSGLLHLTVEGDDAWAVDWFRKELWHHRTNRVPETPGVKLHLLRTRPARSDEFETYSRRLIARWSFLLEISHSTIRIRAHGNRVAIPLIFHMLVSPSLRYLSSTLGVLMLHAGAVSQASSSLVLTGAGGTGKTTLTSMLLAADPNRGLQADDYVLLDARNATTHPFITRSHLYGDLLSWLPELKTRLSWSERARATLLQRARSWSKGALQWPVRLPVERLWGQRTISQKSRLATLVVLQRGDDSEPVLESVDNAIEVLDPLIGMNFAEAHHFTALMRQTFGEHHAGQLIDDWRARERHLLGRILESAKVMILTIPRVASAEYAREITSVLSRQFER